MTTGGTPRARAHEVLDLASLGDDCGRHELSSTLTVQCRNLVALIERHDAEMAEARDAARKRTFSDVLDVLHNEAQRMIGLVEAQPGNEGTRGREAGVHNAMAVVLRLACPDAADAEDAIETVASWSEQ